MEGIRVENVGGKVEIYTPYNCDFIDALKAKVGGARWDAAKKCWTAPEEMLDAVRAILKDVYGYTDIEDAGKLYTVRLESLYAKADRAPVSAFNKVIARAWGRDSGAVVGDDVIFVEGSPKSGGSRNNWETIIPEGCVIDVLHVPEKALEKFKEELAGETCPDYKIVSETVEEEKKDDQRAKLLEEREKLLARLAEINKELGE